MKKAEPIFRDRYAGARVFYNSCHASIEMDMCQIFQYLGIRIEKGNFDRTYAERPRIPGYNEGDYGDEIRQRVDTLTCRAEDFGEADFIFFVNPSDFVPRMKHFSSHRPTVMYLNGQWVEEQCDNLAGAINGQWDRGEECSIWVACYSRFEENYLRARVHSQLQDRIHHIRFAKKFEDYCPEMVQANYDPARAVELIGDKLRMLYTTCHSIHHRPESCRFDDWKVMTEGLPHLLSGRHTDEIEGMGMIPFDMIRFFMKKCACYVGVPCWPAPIVLNMVEALMSGAPSVFYNNGRGVIEDGIFNDGVGSCSNDRWSLRRFAEDCLKDKEFRRAQSVKSLTRAFEFFEFTQQANRWGELFATMSSQWKGWNKRKLSAK